MRRLSLWSVLTGMMIASTGPAALGVMTVEVSTPGTPDLSKVLVGETIHVRVDTVVDNPPAGERIEEILISVGHEGLVHTGFVLDPAFVAGGDSQLSGPYTAPNRVSTWADVFWAPPARATGYSGKVMEFDLLAPLAGTFYLSIGPEESGYTLSGTGNVFISNPFSIPVTVVPEPSALLSAAIGIGAVGLLGCGRRRLQDRSGTAGLNRWIGCGTWRRVGSVFFQRT